LYENEVHVHKEGKRTERETWHNVGDEDIERFKVEWNEQQNGKQKFDPPAAVTNAAKDPTPDSPTTSGESP
jgi:hypothetical protein